MTVLVGAASLSSSATPTRRRCRDSRCDLGHRPRGFRLRHAAWRPMPRADWSAGLILESRGLLPPRVRTAFMLAMIWCAALAAFARAGSYAACDSRCCSWPVSSNSHSIRWRSRSVQLNAPNEIRGRVIGVFSMSANGLRTFSGLCVGLLGASIGIHNSLALSAAGAVPAVCSHVVTRSVGRPIGT